MNWDNLFKYLYKAFLISYMVLWSMELTSNQDKYLTICKDTLFTLQTSYLGMEPSFFALGKQAIVYYSHFLIVVAVTIVFSWVIHRPLAILCLLANFFLFSTKKELLFIGVDVVLLAVVAQINLKTPQDKLKTFWFFQISSIRWLDIIF